MKIYKPIGSKERFLEMFQGVNKGLLNEVQTNVMQTGTQLVEKAFDELRNKQANVKQTNTQVADGYNFVEIVTTDQNGNEITFTFKINSNEGDQDGVYNVGEATLYKFKIVSPTVNVEMPENMKAVQEFNAGHGSEIMDVVSQYADFETDTANVDDVSVDDDVYVEAVNLIDKIPYKKGSEEIQTHHNYADNKPTNPKLRVDSDELQKFVSEMEDFIAGAEADDDILNKTPEDYMAESTDQDQYEDVVFMQGEEADEPLNILYNQGKDAALQYLMQWHDPGNHMGSDSLGHGSSDQTYEKDGYIMSWNRPLNYIGLQYDLSKMNEVKNPSNPQEHAFQRKYGDNWEEERKKYLERNVMTDDDWKQSDADIDATLNNNVDETENEYPNQIGKKFKPKNQMPKKKKKPQSVVKLGEESEIPQEYWGNPEDELNETNVGNDEYFPITTPVGSQDDKLFVSVVNQGIDSHLEGFTKSKFDVKNTTTGRRRIFNFHQSELPILLRRLEELGTEEALSWKDDIENYDESLYEGEEQESNGEDFDIDKIVVDKEETGDMIAGGLADEKSPNDFDKEQLALGLKVELEHSDNPMIALEIAMDHLTEDPEYYTVKDDPEASAQFGAAKDVADEGLNDITPEDEEETDELLGYKPFNVNDYSNEFFDIEGQKNIKPERKGDVKSPYFDVQKNKTNEVDIVKDNGEEDFGGDIGDRYRDAKDNDYRVRDDNNGEGEVILQGQSGVTEIEPDDIKYLERLSEAKLVLRNRSNKLSKKEAVQILIKHNIK